MLALKREGYRKTDVSLQDCLEIFSYPGFWRMALRYGKSGLEEWYRSYSRRAFLRSVQRLVPQICEEDLLPGGSGVRAQALSREGNLLDDFHLVQNRRMIHVCNAPSPAATASIPIGEYITDAAAKQFLGGKGLGDDPADPGDFG